MTKRDRSDGRRKSLGRRAGWWPRRWRKKVALMCATSAHFQRMHPNVDS